VVHVEKKGYGAALLGGIAAARGKYVVMGDSDCSYDFGEVPRFLGKLEEGYDLVMGNRFAGGILPGAMPWHHRYIGNPILSGLGRLLYRTPCRDWHCGLRAFDREKIQALNLKAPGMEFASEMVIRASQGKLRMGEIPIQLHPDGRIGPPHLRSFRDGVRHLWLILRAFRRASVVLVLIKVCLVFVGCFFSPSFGKRV
jgi:glycosyltransferase involved in cell wall biosynthesis